MKYLLLTIFHYCAIQHSVSGDATTFDRTWTTKDTGTIDLNARKFRRATISECEQYIIVKNRKGDLLETYYIDKQYLKDHAPLKEQPVPGNGIATSSQ